MGKRQGGFGGRRRRQPNPSRLGTEATPPESRSSPGKTNKRNKSRKASPCRKGRKTSVWPTRIRRTPWGSSETQRNRRSLSLSRKRRWRKKKISGLLRRRRISGVLPSVPRPSAPWPWMTRIQRCKKPQLCESNPSEEVKSPDARRRRGCVRPLPPAAARTPAALARPLPRPQPWGAEAAPRRRGQQRTRIASSAAAAASR
mmetsp:Transcript_25126/g.83822  ORF Transcript_25126/g.83822 Transcript_25126/m.83822 type:complete len:201 (-) Transcript_25126:1477-2079(-)